MTKALYSLCFVVLFANLFGPPARAELLHCSIVTANPSEQAQPVKFGFGSTNSFDIEYSHETSSATLKRKVDASAAVVSKNNEVYPDLFGFITFDADTWRHTFVFNKIKSLGDTYDYRDDFRVSMQVGMPHFAYGKITRETRQHGKVFGIPLYDWTMDPAKDVQGLNLNCGNVNYFQGVSGCRYSLTFPNPQADVAAYVGQVPFREGIPLRKEGSCQTLVGYATEGGKQVKYQANLGENCKSVTSITRDDETCEITDEVTDHERY